MIHTSLLSNFPEKATIVNIFFFVSLCILVESNNSLRPFCIKTKKSLSCHEITDIFAIIENLDPINSYGWVTCQLE